jgi:hypothetical protein
MIRMSVKTKLAPEEVIKRAIAYFAKGGLGLTISAQDSTSISFQGGGGRVDLATTGKVSLP